MTKHHSLIGIFILQLAGIVFCSDTDYFQQHVTYDIEVTLDDSLHTLNGYEKLTYTNNSPDTLDFIWFHLWPNAYKNNETALAKQKFRLHSTRFYFSDNGDRGFIDSLNFKISGKDIDWKFHKDWIDVVKIFLPEPLAPGNSIMIETPFFVKLPKIFSRLGHTGKHYEITQWYPKPAVYDHKGWHPMPYLDMGEFYSEFGTFDVKITLPQNYRIMATGDLVNGEDEYRWLDSLAAEGDSLHNLEKKAFKKALKILKKGKEKKESSNETKLKTLHFHQENVHDFAWFADPKWIVRKGEIKLADSTRTVMLWSMYLPKNAEQWENSIEYLHDATYWYSKFYGDYPYNHVTAVDGDLSAGGGMEYPNITVISAMPSKHILELVIMHEVGHNWFYGILGSNERDHIWMDEGLNEYANIKYWEKKYGREASFIFNEFTQEKLKIGNNITYGFQDYIGYTNRAQSSDEEPLETSSNDYQSGYNYWLNYSKTGLYTRYLQHYLGEGKMDQIMQDYYEIWKFKHPYPEDFKYFFDKHTDNNLDWYFQDVFHETKTVDYSVSIKNQSAVIENFGTTSPPVEIAFYDQNDYEINRQWIEGFSGALTQPIPQGTKNVKIDPDNFLPDVNRLNNTTHHPLKLTFIFDEPDYSSTEIYWLPWIFDRNDYNGWTPGIMLYSGFVPGYDYGIGTKVLRDFRNDEIAGSLSYKRNFRHKLGFHSGSLITNVARNSGRKGYKISLSGKMKKPIIRTPVTRIQTTLFYHDIKQDAVDPEIYEFGKFTTVHFDINHRWNPNPLFSVSGGMHVTSGIEGGQFTKASFRFSLYKRFTKKIKSNFRIWVGGFLDAANVPIQYLTYLSGGVDPDFEEGSVHNRTEKNNYRKVYHRQFVADGPNLRGLLFDADEIPFSSNELVWALNIDQSLPYIPGKLFLDFAKVTEISENYFDFGLFYEFGPLSLIVPLYQSWDGQTTPDELQWLTERFRFEFSLSGFNIGSAL
tara:strand:+ start:26362 stop:29307 length:2946 start_codon:yes stop_codon:yes gene_type:complete